MGFFKNLARNGLFGRLQDSGAHPAVAAQLAVACYQDSVSEKLARSQAWTFDRRIRVRTRADIDAAIPLIRQAFGAQGG